MVNLCCPCKPHSTWLWKNFTEAVFPDIKGLEVPFSPIGPESTPAKRHEYITLDRLIKYGGTPGCKACKAEAVLHTPVCKLKKRQAKIRKMLKLATSVAAEKIGQGCSVTFEGPKESLLWQDPVFLALEKRMNMKRVTFHGWALGLMGLKDPIKKPWCVSTTSLRVLQLFGQRQCDKSHSHEPGEGSKTKATGHYNKQFAPLVVEALFPWRYYRSVPSVRADNAYVTKNPSRNEWLRDLSGIKAVQAEAIKFHLGRRYSSFAFPVSARVP